MHDPSRVRVTGPLEPAAELKKLIANTIPAARPMRWVCSIVARSRLRNRAPPTAVRVLCRPPEPGFPQPPRAGGRSSFVYFRVTLLPTQAFSRVSAPPTPATPGKQLSHLAQHPP